MQWFVDLCVQPGGYWVAVVLLALLGCLTVLTTVALVQWRKVRQAEQQAVLTQDMLQRGMSAEDILQVLAGSKGVGSKQNPPSPIRLQETADYKS